VRYAVSPATFPIECPSAPAIQSGNFVVEFGELPSSGTFFDEQIAVDLEIFKRLFRA
jgi:hypothetical protein